MKIVFAPDSFKGSLSAAKVSGILRKKAEEIFTRCEMREIPLADGDVGTIDTLVSVLGGRYEHATVHDYKGDAVEVTYGLIWEDTVVIETSQVLRDGKNSDFARKNLLFSSSAGVGELMQQVLDMGYRKIYIGAGNSFSNDGGMGCAQVLGVQFFDDRDNSLDAAGINLRRIAGIDCSRLDPRIKETEITVMCAVNNTPTGEEGCTYVYGAQNGGGPDELILLEQGMRNYVKLAEQISGVSVCKCAGCGASGGLPVSLKAFMGARIVSGISMILSLTHFEELIGDASLVVVGEGVLDRTSIFGKAISGIGMMCKARGIPAVALVGRMGKGAELLYQLGVTSVISSVNAVMDEEEAIENAEELVAQAAEQMFRFLVAGMEMQKKEAFLPDAGICLYPRGSEKNTIHWAMNPNWEE